jgi:hypothetical protein
MQKIRQNISSLGFANIDVDGGERPQFLLCMNIFAADSMKPNEFKRRLQTVDAEYVGKRTEFFS